MLTQEAVETVLQTQTVEDLGNVMHFEAVSYTLLFKDSINLLSGCLLMSMC